MITREQIHELAQFEDQGACALSFYFQPAAPRNRAHKEEAILTKDLAREALRQLESKTNSKNRSKSNSKNNSQSQSQGQSKDKCESARADLDRIVRLSQDLRGSGARAKAVFACSAQGFWREYDLPAQLGGTELLVDRHFHLKPLAQLLGASPSLCIVLVDRHRARLFDLHLGELTEREGFFHPLSRRGRGDGFAGYDGGHAERRVADEARHHFKFVADFLKDALDNNNKDKNKNKDKYNGKFENWILGCQETLWPQFEPQLHPYVAQKLLGRFSTDVAHVRSQEIRSHAEQIFADAQQTRCQEAVRETMNQARSNARGVTGLRRVLRSLEAGEVQTVLLGQNYHAQAVECSGCGHLDAHLVSFCPVCGRETREVVDVAEAILPWVIRHDIELFYVKDDPEFDKVGNIAALLRYRSEQNSNNNLRSITDVPPHRSLSHRTGLLGRYRGLASG
jgi:peptide subunit release factor 1 (eRF1)